MLFRVVRAENRKLNRSALWIVFFVVPLISAVYGTFNYTQNLGVLTREWYSLWTQHTLFYDTFFFAPMIAVYAAYLWRLEHLGHNWNLILSAPVRPFCLYFAKFVTTAKMAFLTQVWVYALFILCGRLWANLPGWPPAQIPLWLLRGFAGGLAVIALQCLLSMVIRSFAVPVLIALCGGIVGMLLLSKDAGMYWPYALMILGMNANRTEDMISDGLLPFLLSCAVFIVLFCCAAVTIMTTRDVKT